MAESKLSTELGEISSQAVSWNDKYESYRHETAQQLNEKNYVIEIIKFENKEAYAKLAKAQEETEALNEQLKLSGVFVDYLVSVNKKKIICF